MKLQFASDLHLEFVERELPFACVVEPATGADLLVLAGDVHNGIKAISRFRNWPVPIVYVAGNHEFYRRHWDETRIELREACAGTHITYLDNDSAVFNGVRILGCTLWTDFQLAGFTQEQWMRHIDASLNDRLIHTESGPLKSHQMLKDHQFSRQWLDRELAKPFAGKTVVTTHHGPHPMSIHPRFAGHRLNAGFVSDLTGLLPSADLWLHGHVHNSFDYQVGRCRVVANPAGYALNAAAAATSGLKFENPDFDPGLVLEVNP